MAQKTCAIIGMGSLGSGSWFKEIQKEGSFKCIGVVDTDTELLEHVDQWGLSEEQGFTSIDHMVKEYQKPDLAIIATPIYTHHVLVKETMDLGINVICEKNMASSIYQGRQMVQCAIDHPELATAIGTQYRYYSKNWCAHQFFKQKENPIGDLAYIRWSGTGNWGEKRTGWRRWIQDIFLEDMCTHYFDLLRYITGKDVVQVKCDTFIPKFSQWQGSSTCFVNLALADPDDYNHRRNWVWVQLYGDWQRRGTKDNSEEFNCAKGRALMNEFGLTYVKFLDEDGKQVEEEGFLNADAGPVEGFKNLTGQEVILAMMNRAIDTKAKQQCGTHFREAFKSFSISMAAIESSRSGKAVWVPDFWKDINLEL